MQSQSWGAEADSQRQDVGSIPKPLLLSLNNQNRGGLWRETVLHPWES